MLYHLFKWIFGKKWKLVYDKETDSWGVMHPSMRKPDSFGLTKRGAVKKRKYLNRTHLVKAWNILWNGSPIYRHYIRD